MNRLAQKNLSIVALVALLGGAAACGENISLVGRSAPELEGDEIVGEITGIDTRLNEIHVRPTRDSSSRGGTRTIRYEDNAQVIYRGREFPPSSLEVGDIVALQVWNRNRGESTNLIRVQQSSRDRDVARSGSSTSGQRIEGTVERVDPRAGIIELREPGGANTIVSLPPDAGRSTVEQLERLRRGDYVLGEGRYTGRDRFLLEHLL
jgi:hypothetical protein